MVIMTAVIIGVWSMLFLGALMRGISDQMARNGIATLTGHIQIHQKGYRNDPVIENSIKDTMSVERIVNTHLPPDAVWTTRIRVNAIASNARHSSGVKLVGIAPKREMQISFIGEAVKQGRYLKSDDKHGIVVGKALVEKFETKLGRKLVIMSQDTTGEIASRAFRIVGIYRAEMEATEKQFAFISLPSAQEMLKTEQSYSEVSILLSSRENVKGVAAAIRNDMPAESYEIHTWLELLPMIKAILEMYDGILFLWYLVVFIAMGFGIVNTTLMAVFERIREFGLLKSLGMKPFWIVKGVLIESFFLLILGMLIGNSLGMLSVFVLADVGIDLSFAAKGMEFVGMSRIIYPISEIKDIILANLVVLVLGLLVSIYPAVKAARFRPVEALAHT